MVNCNPETVSTDYDTSDRLYFEPLTLEDVLAVVEVERAAAGVIVQFGGQTPLKLAAGLVAAGVPLLGTSVEAIDLAEDRGRFGALLERLGYKAPPYATARSVAEALAMRRAGRLPAARAALLRARRPRDGDRLLAARASPTTCAARRRGGRRDLPRPLPRERHRGRRRRALRRARGVDRRDHAARRGGRRALRRQRLRAAAALARRGDARADPRATREIALAIGVVGLLNVQYAVHAGRAVRDRGQPARLAHRAVRLQGRRACRWPSSPAGSCSASGSPSWACRAGREGMGFGDHVSVKEAVLPFDRFEGSDAVLGPEMRSTGEVMGIARDFPTAFAKAQAAAGVPLPQRGHGLHHRHRLRQGRGVRGRPDPARQRLSDRRHARHRRGDRAHGRAGAGAEQDRRGLPARASTGSSAATSTSSSTRRPGSGARTDGWEIRRAAVAHGIPCLTTLSAGVSAARAIASARRDGEPEVLCLQELHGAERGAGAPCAAAAPPADGRRCGVSTARTRALTSQESSSAPTACCASPTPTDPRPLPGQFAMLAAAERWGGGEDERPVPAARLLDRAPRAAASRSSCSRTSGPGTARLCELRAGDELCAARAARHAASRAPPTARRAILVGGGVGIAPLAILQDAARRAQARRRCSASATARARSGAAPARRGAGRHRRRLGRASRPRHRPAGRGARARRGTRSSTPAGRRRCSRPCAALCAARAAPPRSSRSRRGWRAASAPASAASCRARGGGYLRVCVDGPVLDAAALERVDEHAGRRRERRLLRAASSRTR